MDHNIYRASFNPIAPNTETSSHDLLEEECKRILNANEQVEIGPVDQHFPHFPYITRLILSLYYTLARKMPLKDLSADSGYTSNTLSPILKCSLLKLLAAIIEKKLFLASESQKLYEEISYSLVFKPSLFSLLLSVLSDNTNFVAIDKLVAFFTNLLSEQFPLLVPMSLYHLFGGGLFTIEAKVFREKLTYLVESLGRALSASETVINRNIEDFKGNKERQIILQESVKTLMLSKNKETLVELVTQISNYVFVSRQYLQREEFLFQLQTRPIEPTLTIYLLLARSESILFEERSFRSGVVLRSQITGTNFYAAEMTKLFNKCPFNGDERCNCKKCQCVRRNRESAKLSQEKKRNAVEQVDALTKRIAELEQRDQTHQKRILELEQKAKTHARRNMELQEENLMLKSLLKEMKANPNIKQLMMQTIQPVSKILNNDL